MELLRSALWRRDRFPFHVMIESEENSIDPDDGNSWVCSACTLPIFSTPFQRSKQNVELLLHDQCAALPKKLMDHPFHPRQALHLVKNEDSSSSTISCDKCNQKCGSMFYKCFDSDCDLRLDLLCSLPMIKILHRSHEHRLMVIRGSASFICGACGTQHQGLSDPSYFCSACNFWIHRDCASLPNAIKLLHHQHSLFLTYDRSSSISSASSSSSSKCAICGDVLQSLGVYLCLKCGYYVHITCATSDPHSFQPVLIRDADLLHLPMADERANLVQYMLENTRYSSRVCNACVEYISPPFYSCSKCRDFLLHSCCADLPRKIHHPFHPQHTLFLFTETPESSLERPGFTCDGCLHRCSGFGYSCETCIDFKVDVVCALMPPSITHESHGKTHILHMSRETSDSSYKECSCCVLALYGIFYECSNCRQLKLHVRCALLPTSHTHFDRHPLKLTTSTKISLLTSTNDADGHDSDAEHSEAEMRHICDVCEMNMDKRKWYYSCKQRDSSFHTNCIPFLNHMIFGYKVKYGVSVDVKFHDCPLTLVPEATISGYHCDLCSRKFQYMHDDGGLRMRCAYECTKCNYRVHGKCARKSSEKKAMIINNSG
ncbi:hypothetical protein C2S53_011000 [Perilla frutescens var. hirtella]|uniref:DC1 domain-containing protein n=1 Tax=Perilla frutescens var. hirtella TaxID=608512 RepID=A0AAD4PAA7_PERFH|nr:hypothetical protein C2S53_011000 [Perilla frutescens var. hirtella]